MFQVTSVRMRIGLCPIVHIQMKVKQNKATAFHFKLPKVCFVSLKDARLNSHYLGIILPSSEIQDMFCVFYVYMARSKKCGIIRHASIRNNVIEMFTRLFGHSTYM